MQYDGGEEMNRNLDSLVKEYITEHNIPDGDIIFIGSFYESRQEYGFNIVLLVFSGNLF